MKNKDLTYRSKNDRNRTISRHLSMVCLLSTVLVLNHCSFRHPSSAPGNKKIKNALHLIANTKTGFVPFSITLTARLKSKVVFPDQPGKFIFLWIQEMPSGYSYHAREEFELSSDPGEDDQFFYHTYHLEQSGRHFFYLILFPDDAEKRIVSNKVSVLSRTTGFD
ncbi:hypothetical protein ACFL27_05710 [candidate division CSSED10-310 bacterium]|uniref:Lipoprotein n=1 Tax=candidate division CSSED10-310 bacterium TaxID=2855610 RepID=A0ABV6YU28_UNCC1